MVNLGGSSESLLVTVSRKEQQSISYLLTKGQHWNAMKLWSPLYFSFYYNHTNCSMTKFCVIQKFYSFLCLVITFSVPHQLNIQVIDTFLFIENRLFSDTIIPTTVFPLSTTSSYLLPSLSPRPNPPVSFQKRASLRKTTAKHDNIKYSKTRLKPSH